MNKYKQHKYTKAMFIKYKYLYVLNMKHITFYEQRDYLTIKECIYLIPNLVLKILTDST